MALTEEQLIKGCLKGIASFHQMLYQRYAPKMLTVCLRYAGSKEEAEDILQEGFIIVFDKMEQFRMQGSFEGWIRRIMVNKSLEYLRRNTKIYPVTDVENVENRFVSPDNVLSEIDAKELLKMIQELPPKYKMVFNLFVFEGVGHKEIASLLGIAEGTSKSNLSDARSILKKKITRNLMIEKTTIYYERRAQGE